MGNCLSISCQSNATDSAFSQCFELTSKQAKFVYALEENLDALKRALEELTDSKNDLLRRVKIAEQQQQLKRLDKVQRWITRAEDMEKEVNELISRSTQEVEKLCFWGCCSKSCISSYKHGKAISKNLDELIALQSKGVFEGVAERVLEASVIEMPLEPTIGMEPLFEEVWKDICDNNTRIMGLYGMGGVGKTTLLKKINNKFLETPNCFDSVMLIVVSKDHTLEMIQNDIGEKLGCSEGPGWNHKDCGRKAAQIFEVLSTRKFVLLLDDIWERLDLTKLGVPSPDRLNGSKVIFTTRSKDVCFRMKADRKIEVKCLLWDQSWKLFKEMVGEEALSAHLDIPSLAEIVAKECDGLPLALITIGRAMACKRMPQEWRHAIQVLKNSASEFPGMGDEVLPLLKFSYDNLPSEKVKSCFLYCALFPEDLQIERNSLIEYWIGEGFLETDHEIDEGYDVIGLLLYACLLEEDRLTHVKLHDVIRDMALWIACDCGKARNSVSVHAKSQLLDPPTTENWSEVSRLSLMKNNIKKLSGTPTCLNLLTLFLQQNALHKISDSFFEVMCKLRVLDLSLNFNLTSLPVSISELVSLQYLNLSNTGIRELPGELSKLVMLKYLNFNNLEKLHLIPYQLISNFSQLRILNMFGCGWKRGYQMAEADYEGNEVVLVKKLQEMKHLSSLGLSISNISALESLFTSQKLINCTKDLLVNHIRNKHSLDMLSLSENSKPCYFTNLGRVRIGNCQLLELTWLFYAPKLRSLYISECLALEEIICLDKLGGAETHEEPFQKLEELFLLHLPSLTIIHGKTLSFQSLKFLQVAKCSLLRKVPFSDDNITDRSKLKIRGKRIWWNELKWDNEATQQSLLPCFEPY